MSAPGPQIPQQEGKPKPPPKVSEVALVADWQN
jgi:hypothetical protein